MRDDGQIVDPTVRHREGHDYQYVPGEPRYGPGQVRYIIDEEAIAEMARKLPPAEARKMIEDDAIAVIAMMLGEQS